MDRWRVSRRHPWAERLLLIGLAIGLVVMHHLVGAHQHQTVHQVTGGLSGVAAISSTGHGADHDPTALERGTAQLQQQPAGDPEGMVTMLHLCLAVLAAALVLTGLVLGTLRRADRFGSSRSRVSSWEPSRAPPVPVRLAHLQVLRL